MRFQGHGGKWASLARRKARLHGHHVRLHTEVSPLTPLVLILIRREKRADGCEMLIFDLLSSMLVE